MIAIVDYDAGNVGSVANALKRLDAGFEITSDKTKIEAADGVIFPGQGRAGPAMRSLRASGLDELLPTLKQPFLGVCLGMQLMVKDLEEDDQQGLGILNGKCVRFTGVQPVPHMGWNNLISCRSRLFSDTNDGEYFYFVHSYYVETDNEFVLAETDYGGRFAAAVNKDNFYGVQFHPEKSVGAGEQILKNFLKICGENQ